MRFSPACVLCPKYIICTIRQPLDYMARWPKDRGVGLLFGCGCTATQLGTDVATHNKLTGRRQSPCKWLNEGNHEESGATYLYVRRSTVSLARCTKLESKVRTLYRNCSR